LRHAAIGAVAHRGQATARRLIARCCGEAEQAHRALLVARARAILAAIAVLALGATRLLALVWPNLAPWGWPLASGAERAMGLVGQGVPWTPPGQAHGMALLWLWLGEALAELALAVLLIAQRSLLTLLPADVPRLAEVHADWRMVAFALALSLATGVLVCGGAAGCYASGVAGCVC
jgi:hypothetical protein